MIKQVKFEPRDGYWDVTIDGKDVFKRKPKGKMRAVKSIVSNLTKGRVPFLLTIETGGE